MKLNEIIRAARIKAGYTMKAVEAKIGIVASNQSKIEMGENKSPGFNTIAPLAKLYGLDLNKLYEATLSSESNALIAAQAQSGLKLPVIDLAHAEMWCRGDRGMLMDETRIINSPLMCGSNSFAIRVGGDSMTALYGNVDSFKSGTVLIVDPGVSYKINDFVIAKHKGVIYFRQIVEEGAGHYLKCINPQYQILTIEQDIKVLGVVIGSYNQTRSYI